MTFLWGWIHRVPVSYDLVQHQLHTWNDIFKKNRFM